MQLPLEEMYRIIYQDHRDPHFVLGPHLVGPENKRIVAIRCFLPQARSVTVVADREYPMLRIHEAGFYEAICEDRHSLFPYSLRIQTREGGSFLMRDPYAYPPPSLGDLDKHLLKEGQHCRSFEKLGAHIARVDGVPGVYFSVWAPNARCVSIIGNFNGWDHRTQMMRRIEPTGVWEIFVPGLGEGEVYKYKIMTPDGHFTDKADPQGFGAELSPQTASVVRDIERYKWEDQEWMRTRGEKQGLQAPVSIYEVHIGSWDRKDGKAFLSYRDSAERLVDYVKDMGYTHIELLPIQEHPFYGSWGYQTIGYYAPSSRYGAPEDFMHFVDQCHRNGIGVLLDWAPAHFPRDGHGLGYFDGTYLYEHADARQRMHRDWNTNIFNYGRFEVKNFLISSALFWLEKYHIDGLRVDAVASMLYLDYSKPQGEWVPNQYGGRENLDAVVFLRELNEAVRRYHPGAITVAEESTTWPGVSKPTYVGGLGFHYKWNMGWMNDMLKYMSMDPIFRKYHHHTFSFSIWYTFSENFILPLSHDEVVHGKRSLIDKMPGDLWRRFANLRLLYGYMYAHPGKKLLFMGGEFGQWLEWDHDSPLDWESLNYAPHGRLRDYVRDLNRLYREHTALHKWDADSRGFEWVDYHDADYSIVSFWRRSESESLLFVLNFTPVPHRGYHLGIQKAGTYLEILNSDSELYWGSNTGNMGQVTAVRESWHDMPFHLRLTIPPLGMLVFEWTPDPTDIQAEEELRKAQTLGKSDEKPPRAETQARPGKGGESQG